MNEREVRRQNRPDLIRFLIVSDLEVCMRKPRSYRRIYGYHQLYDRPMMLEI